MSDCAISWGCVSVDVVILVGAVILRVKHYMSINVGAITAKATVLREPRIPSLLVSHPPAKLVARSEPAAVGGVTRNFS